MIILRPDHHSDLSTQVRSDSELTANKGPQVKSHGALQRLVGSSEGVEEEEAGGNRGEEDDDTTEEDDGDVEAGWDGGQEVWEDWERRRAQVRGRPTGNNQRFT